MQKKEKKRKRKKKDVIKRTGKNGNFVLHREN